MPEKPLLASSQDGAATGQHFSLPLSAVGRMCWCWTRRAEGGTWGLQPSLRPVSYAPVEGALSGVGDPERTEL